MSNKKLLITLFLLVFLNSFSQKKEAHLKEGNKEFFEKKYADAEANYRIEKSKVEENNTTASYNLGNSIYRQDFFEESKFAYAQAIENSNDKSQKHKAYHNLGNALMKEKNYFAALEAYKNALRNNPYDQQTRYNYAVAKDLLDKNPPPPDQNQEQDNQDENQQDNDNKENKNNDSQENQDQDQNQENQNQNNQDQNQNNQEDNGIPKQRIENILDAIENQEKGVQQRVQKRKELEQKKGQPRQNEKSW